MFLSLALVVPLFLNTVAGTRPDNICPQATPCVCQNDGLLKSETNVDCRSKGLNGIPSFEKIGAARKINLANNGLSELPANAFRGITTPQIDLSYNTISAIDDRTFEGLEGALKVLVLKRNKFSAIPTASLKRLRKLKSLTLDNNLSLKVLNGSAFRGLSKLETLSLKECSISSLDENSFAGLENLKELSLYDNHIKEINPAVFVPLTKLQDLDLGHNGLDKVPARAFKHLKTLSLSMNNFSSEASFDPAAFEYLSGSLERLKLSDCLMKFIPNRAIRLLSSLKHLELNSNQIQALETNDFSGLSSLQQLMLDDNKRVKFSNGAFSHVANSLKYLSMRTMDLKKLPLKPLQDLIALEKIDISSNKFETFGTGAFEGLCATDYEISRSTVQWISKDAFKNTPNNLNVNLEANIILDIQFLELPCKFAEVDIDVICNCELYFLLKTRNLQLKGKCRRPPDLEGLAIDSEELKTVSKNRCEPNATNFSSTKTEVCPPFNRSEKGKLSPGRCFSVTPGGPRVSQTNARAPLVSSVAVAVVFTFIACVVTISL